MSVTQHNESETVESEIRTPDFVPCVRYAELDDGSLSQMPKLRRMDEKIPDEASFISPVYLLSESQHERLTSNETGWTNEGCVAKELQNECESSTEDGEVLYPIYIESDSLEDGVPAEKLFEWYESFLSEVGIDRTEATYYFSGNRSIHVHVPRFVVGEEGREALQKKVEEFCDETDAELDNIYDQKRVFRLPGVTHAETELLKVKIDFGDSRKEMIRKATNNSTEDDLKPDTGMDLLRQTFEKPAQESVPTPEVEDMEPEVAKAAGFLGGTNSILRLNRQNEKKIRVPLVERENPPDDGKRMGRWLEYNGHPFSPYANAEGGERSIAIFEVRGAPFCRRCEEGIDRGAFVPGYFWASSGCDPEFSVTGDARLRLSERDFKKWHDGGYEERDMVVIIGGKSRNSKIFKVDRKVGVEAAEHLRDRSKEMAFMYLELEGYDIGSAGSDYEDKKNRTHASSNNTTQAERLQQRVENGQTPIQALGHWEKCKVALRLLRIRGWDGTVEWFREAFGSDFDLDTTHTQLESLVDSYDDFSHIDVP